jgi:3-phenylpropionate/trans-cinnamate dioxygenase ferredoxin reductase subunit
MDQRHLRLVWLSVLGLIIAAPGLGYLAMAPSSDGMWDRLSVLSGLLSLSALVCTAVLPSRLRSLNRAFGIETVIDLHRFLGVVSSTLVLAHLACVVAEDPVNILLLNLPQAPGRAQAATVATFALVAIAMLAALRRQYGLSYEVWKVSHIALAATILLGSALHIYLLDQLVNDSAIGPMLTLMALFVLGVAIYRWVWRFLFDPSTEFVVREVRRENATVNTLALVPRQRVGEPSTTWAFEPGQFAWIRLSRSTLAEEHPFTIASSAHLDATEFTIRAAGDFTKQIARLTPGSSVWVDGPHGAFTNDSGPAAAGFVLIAAGVGITPMMSMLRTAAHRGDPRPYRLIVVASKPEDLLFREEFALQRRYLDLDVTEVLRRPAPGWSGPTGGLGPEVLSIALAGLGDPGELDYFICGPPAMVTDAVDLLDAIGVASARVHTEQFDFV